MIKTKINVNRTDSSELSDANNGKKSDNFESTSNCESNDEQGFEPKQHLEDDKSDNYLISWNSIFYEVNDLNSKTSLINRLFRKDMFNENNKEKNEPNIPNSNEIHILERHRQRNVVQIMNNENSRTVHIDHHIENETIKIKRPLKRTILNKISGSLGSGKLLALIGPSGVGELYCVKIKASMILKNYCSYFCILWTNIFFA